MTLWGVWEICVNFTEYILMWYLFKKQLGLDQKKVPISLLSVVVLTGILTLINFINITYYWTLFGVIKIYATRIIMLALDITFVIVIFESNLSKKIMWAFMPTLFTLIADFVAGQIGGALGWLNEDVSESWEYGFVRFKLTLLYLLASFVLYMIFANLRGKDQEKDIYLPLYNRIFMIGILVVGIVGAEQFTAVALDLGGSGYEYHELYVKSIIALIIFFFILLSTFFLFSDVGILGKKSIEQAIETKMIKTENKYYKDMNQMIQTIKEVKHNLKNNLMIMQYLLDNNSYGELNDYFIQILGKYEETTSIALAENPVISGILTAKLKRANELNIDFRFNVCSIDSDIKGFYDICTILDNILDNALEACEKIKGRDKKIDLFIETRGEMLIIKCDNSSNGNYKYDNNKLASQKQGDFHGIGLNYIQSFVKKQEGSVIIEPKEHTFHIIILLPLEYGKEESG